MVAAPQPVWGGLGGDLSATQDRRTNCRVRQQLELIPHRAPLPSVPLQRCGKQDSYGSWWLSCCVTRHGDFGAFVAPITWALAICLGTAITQVSSELRRTQDPPSAMGRPPPSVAPYTIHCSALAQAHSVYAVLCMSLCVEHAFDSRPGPLARFCCAENLRTSSSVHASFVHNHWMKLEGYATPKPQGWGRPANQLSCQNSPMASMLARSVSSSTAGHSVLSHCGTPGASSDRGSLMFHRRRYGTLPRPLTRRLQSKSLRVSRSMPIRTSRHRLPRAHGRRSETRPAPASRLSAELHATDESTVQLRERVPHPHRGSSCSNLCRGACRRNSPRARYARIVMPSAGRGIAHQIRT